MCLIMCCAEPETDSAEPADGSTRGLGSSAALGSSRQLPLGRRLSCRSVDSSMASEPGTPILSAMVPPGLERADTIQRDAHNRQIGKYKVISDAHALIMRN